MEMQATHNETKARRTAYEVRTLSISAIQKYHKVAALVLGAKKEKNQPNVSWKNVIIFSELMKTFLISQFFYRRDWIDQKMHTLNVQRGDANQRLQRGQLF